MIEEAHPPGAHGHGFRWRAVTLARGTSLTRLSSAPVAHVRGSFPTPQAASQVVAMMESHQVGQRYAPHASEWYPSNS